MQHYIEGIEHVLDAADQPPLSRTERIFARWAANNIRSFEQAAWEVLKARRGGAPHPALDVLTYIDDEPLPFIA